MKRILSLASVFFLNISIFSQTELYHNLDEVIVTASKTPSLFSEITRTVAVIDQKEIESSSASSLQEILQLVVGADVRERGVFGVQADVSLRGGTFEQTLILINGVKVNDPQTGHHNLDIPISLNDIKKIEILKGPGSRLYGPNAFSGVINIITKYADEAKISLNAEGGENNYYSTNLSLSAPLLFLNNRVSVNKKKSDSYSYNNYFDISSVFINSQSQLSFGKIKLDAGYIEKSFGANSFYTSSFPNQTEATKTTFASLSSDFAFGNFYFSPSFSWRKHNDDFILDNERPVFYRNIHETNIYTGEFTFALSSLLGKTSVGGEYSTDKITSINLGDHTREKYGISLEHRTEIEDIVTILFGGFAYKYSEFGWRFWPGVDIGYHFGKNINLYFTVGQSFRIPTYTDLYYRDPATIGNPNLKPEEAASYEAGMNFSSSVFGGNISIFRRNGTNIIDYVKYTPTDSVWQAANITDVNTTGIELNTSFQIDHMLKQIPFNKIGFGYSYLNTEKSFDGFDSEYAIDNLRHQLIVTIQNELFFGIEQSWGIKYQDRINLENFTIIDTKLYRQFELLRVYLKINNLFNEPHTTISGVPLPGRWIIAGINLDVDF